MPAFQEEVIHGIWMIMVLMGGNVTQVMFANDYLIDVYMILGSYQHLSIKSIWINMKSYVGHVFINMGAHHIEPMRIVQDVHYISISYYPYGFDRRRTSPIQYLVSTRGLRLHFVLVSRVWIGSFRCIVHQMISRHHWLMFRI